MLNRTALAEQLHLPEVGGLPPAWSPCCICCALLQPAPVHRTCASCALRDAAERRRLGPVGAGLHVWQPPSPPALRSKAPLPAAAPTGARRPADRCVGAQPAAGAAEPGGVQGAAVPILGGPGGGGARLGDVHCGERWAWRGRSRAGWGGVGRGGVRGKKARSGLGWLEAYSAVQLSVAGVAGCSQRSSAQRRWGGWTLAAQRSTAQRCCAWRPQQVLADPACRPQGSLCPVLPCAAGGCQQHPGGAVAQAAVCGAGEALRAAGQLHTTGGAHTRGVVEAATPSPHSCALPSSSSALCSGQQEACSRGEFEGEQPHSACCFPALLPCSAGCCCPRHSPARQPGPTSAFPETPPPAACPVPGGAAQAGGAADGQVGRRAEAQHRHQRSAVRAPAAGAAGGGWGWVPRGCTAQHSAARERGAAAQGGAERALRATCATTSHV